LTATMVKYGVQCSKIFTAECNDWPIRIKYSRALENRKKEKISQNAIL